LAPTSYNHNYSHNHNHKYKYHLAALGGTFDHLHRGHKALLERAFETSEGVVIGLTSDQFARSSGKKIELGFDRRKEKLVRYLRKTYPGRRYEITKLETRFGPAIYTKEIDAIVVSAETLHTVEDANQKRRELGLAPLRVEVVPMVMAEDNNRISSTRIRAGEIDAEGRLLSNSNKRGAHEK
jgi:pantetheine-phosphate adenylyltransferase